jgi:hypothetical protein
MTGVSKETGRMICNLAIRISTIKRRLQPVANVTNPFLTFRDHLINWTLYERPSSRLIKKSTRTPWYTDMVHQKIIPQSGYLVQTPKMLIDCKIAEVTLSFCVGLPRIIQKIIKAKIDQLTKVNQSRRLGLYGWKPYFLDSPPLYANNRI